MIAIDELVPFAAVEVVTDDHREVHLGSCRIVGGLGVVVLHERQDGIECCDHVLIMRIATVERITVARDRAHLEEFVRTSGIREFEPVTAGPEVR